MEPRIALDTGASQRGSILALFAISLISILALVGLALDGAHAYLNKTRLQNTVDAAALSAAKTLDQTGDTAQAVAEALQMFSSNAGNSGNNEMAAAYGAGNIGVTVQFSNTLHPFATGTVPPLYVRVTATNFTLPAWFIRVLGFNDKVVGASAVAGPSPTINTACNLAPMMVCGDPAAPPADHFGYELGEATVLKTSTTGGNWEVGPGNFQLIRLGGSGANVVRQNMAGSYAGCLTTGETIPTQPGNQVGPVVQGLNTRFGDYRGPMGGTQSQYPPDVVVESPTPQLTYNRNTDTIYYQGQPLDGPPDPDYYDYADYQADVSSGSYDYTPIDEGGIGVFGRRILAVPVGDCSTTTNGQGDVPLLGFLCYHLIQPAVQQGNESHVYGQFIDTGCPITGRPGPAPGAGPGPYVIQLYKDEAQEAS
jgi:hypothetical protein